MTSTSFTGRISFKRGVHNENPTMHPGVQNVTFITLTGCIRLRRGCITYSYNAPHNASKIVGNAPRGAFFLRGFAPRGANCIKFVVLGNEKYKGDALLQKTFRTDFLTKKTKINEGEVPQYYVDHSHPAIIDPALYDAVQIEMKARVRSGRRNYTPHFFSGRIYCAECGGLYGSNTYRHQTVWRCNNRHRKTTDCQTPALRNQTIEDAFVMAFNHIIEQKDSIMATCLSIMTERCDTTAVEKEITRLRAELAIVAEAMTEQINMNARVAIEQNGYKQQFRELETQSKDIQEKINALEQQRITLQAKLNAIRVYIDTLRSQNRITGFSETLWLNTVERLWIGKGGVMKFEFKGGQCVEG